MPKTATNGDTVVVWYRASLKDGTYLGELSRDDPRRFILGRSKILTGFDIVFLGMVPGEKKNVFFPPERAFGRYDASKVFAVRKPNGAFEAIHDIYVGLQLDILCPDKTTGTVTVLETSDESVLVDANHPFSGMFVYFEIELLDVVESVQRLGLDSK